MPFTVGVSISGTKGDLLSTAATVAERAERLGFDSVEFAEGAHDPFLACVVAAEHSSRLQVHTSVAIAFPRSPMVTAMLAWDLQRFSGGRFVLGLGTQVKAHSERRFSVPWTAPAPRVREYIRAMEAIWTTFQDGAPLRFEGKHYQFSLMNPNFNPGPIEHPGIPVELAAVNPFNAGVAGEVCSGIKLHPFHTPGYLREVLLPSIERGRARAGRDRAGFTVRGGGLIASGRRPADLEQSGPGSSPLDRVLRSHACLSARIRPTRRARAWRTAAGARLAG